MKFNSLMISFGAWNDMFCNGDGDSRDDGYACQVNLPAIIPFSDCDVVTSSDHCARH